MTKIEKIIMQRMEVENKKEKEMEKSIAIQQELMRKIAELQQQLADEQNHWQEQQKQFNNELSCYDHDLKYYMMQKDTPEQKEESHDDSDK